ncbi:helix-turn-helix transcriptional regulator [Cerasicoccus frondis]|uniref:helix-turn-helix transcriptional regulator n=1 Tax=Cerasicoccus frondis TaxID=490090 RepID=UPI002852A2E9|nr:helix-turn-helix transcriptional regulator [Cerasicoccus frondis]
MKITNDAMRAARALLGLTQQDVENATGVAAQLLSPYEIGKKSLSEKSKDMLVSFYREHGIRFTPFGGVEFAPKEYVYEWHGKEGFARFRADVLAEAQKPDCDICISSIDEREFDKWGAGEINESYRNAMAELRSKRIDYHFRSLAKEGDRHFSAHRHSQYRWIPEAEFADFPYYIYGDKTAMLLFEREDMHIFVITHPIITQFFRNQFNSMWDRAIPVEDE